MKMKTKKVSIEWIVFYAIFFIGLIAVLVVSWLSQNNYIDKILLTFAYLIWYIAIIISIVLIIVKRFKWWRKGVFEYQGNNEGFLKIENKIDDFRKERITEEKVYKSINKVYDHLEADLDEILNRQNYLRNRLRFTGEIIQMILSIGIAVVFGTIQEFNANVGGSYILYLVICFLVVVLCVLSFPISIFEPDYDRFRAIYEYENKRLEKALYRMQKNI